MTEKKLSTDAFKALLNEQLRKICTEKKWNFDNAVQRGDAFQLWIADLFCRRDEGIDGPAEESVFFNNDCKIDIILEDSNQKSIYLIQTKNIKFGSNVDEGEVNDFCSRHDLFLDRDWVKKHCKNEAQFEYLGSYQALLDDGYNIQYIFISTGVASDRTKDVVSSKQAKIAREYPGISLHIMDFSDVKELFIEAQTLEQSIPDSVKFQLPQDRWVVKNKPHKTVLAIVKGNTLVSLYKKERERLFSYNIRSYLGRKGLNKEIINTAESFPGDFYYFNNGVSAICTSFEIDENNHFVARNFQIINGAQTIGALSASKLNADVEVLLRVTEGLSVKTDKGFNADIIKFNNTQNVVKSSDFRANDKIQLWLEKKFKELRPRGALRPITYFRKRSNKRSPGNYVLKLEDLAKIRYAFNVEPTRAVADPKSLWTYRADGGAYEDAFGVDGEVTDFWSDDDFETTLFAIAFYIEIERRIDEAIKKDRANLYLRRLRYFALALAKEYVEIKYPNDGTKTLLASESLFDKCFKDFWPEGLKALLFAHQQATENDRTTVFALVRSDQRWRSTRDNFVRFLKLTS